MRNPAISSFWRPFSLTTVVLFAVLSATTCMLAKRAWDDARLERTPKELRQELETTRSRLENGEIVVHQPVADYLRLARPCRVESYGPYTKHDHGFVGGLGHGITVISKEGHLVKACSWSCLGGDTYFDAMDEAEEVEFHRHWYAANLGEGWRVWDFLRHLSTIELDPSRYASYTEYHNRVRVEIERFVNQVSSPELLKDMFFRCWDEVKDHSSHPTPQEKLVWINPFNQALQVILFRLADINTDESTRVLVALFADEDIGYDGEFALNVGNAISRCGKKAIPYLRELPSGRRSEWANDIIASIEAGQLYGP